MRILLHASPDECDLPIELRREIDEQLQSIDACGEGRDDDLAGRAAEHFFKTFDHVALGAGKAAAIRVRAVGEKREHAGRAELGEPMQIERLSVERRLIDLEIAGVNQNTSWRVNRQRDAVRHAMRDAHKLDAQRTDAD